jgi:hypothetical protein
MQSEIEISPKAESEAIECLESIDRLVKSAVFRAQQRAADQRSIREEGSRRLPKSEGVKLPRKSRGWFRDLITRLTARRVRSA